MGDLHWFQKNFGIISQLIAGSGFEDIHVVFQSGLCASGSLRGVMSGKHYNHAWRVHEHFSDALEQLLLSTFLDNNPANQSVEIPRSMLQLINSLPHPTDFDNILSQEDFAAFFDEYESFRQQVCDGMIGKTPQLWILYLDLIDLQKMLHAAIKENDLDV